MVQLLIELTESERHRLSVLAQRTGKAESAVVREALRQWLDEIEPTSAGEDPLRAAFGLWKGLGIDGMDHQRTLRGEWV